MYRDLSHYITTRLAAIGESAASLSERFGWAPAYVSNIINEQFRPSRKRCLQMAETFGDDPNIILALAGFYVPQEQDHSDFLAMLNSLSPESQERAMSYLSFLKWEEDNQE